MSRHSTPPVAHPYVRISHPDQRKSGGLERQTAANLEEFCRRFGFVRGKRIWIDDGVSAFKGVNASPEHQLGQFLAEARKGLIPAGDCLLLENYDRLSRQDPWAAIGLVNELRQLQIHVGRLDRMKLLRYDSTDYGDFFEASVEFMRGNSESAAKSMRNGAAWQRKRKGARQSGAVITHRLPAWVKERDGQLHLVPDRAAIVKRIFVLAAGGYGHALIVKKLTVEKVPAFGDAGHWARSYIALILKDRRALGEFQPRLRNGRPDGEVIKSYFPAAVTEDEWLAARAGAAQRKKKPGRQARYVNVFAGLLRNALDGDSYYCATRTDGGKPTRVLINTNAAEGRAPMRSFPFATFEEAILSLLREIDPHEILNGDAGPDESLVLAGELARVESELAEASAFMEAHGFSPTIGKRITDLEARKGELLPRLIEARQRAAHPLSECWGEAKTLLGAIHKASDPQDARLRLQSILRRIVDTIQLLVMPCGRNRLCAVQMWFTGGERHRDYLILHRPPKANRTSRTEGGWSALSFAAAGLPADVDLRKRADAGKVEKMLAGMELPS